MKASVVPADQGVPPLLPTKDRTGDGGVCRVEVNGIEVEISLGDGDMGCDNVDEKSVGLAVTGASK